MTQILDTAIDTALDDIDAGPRETKAFGTRPRSRQVPDADVKAAVVAIGQEVLKIGETVKEVKQRYTGPADVRSKRLRAWDVYQKALDEVHRQRRSGRGVDPLTAAKLRRLDDVLDRYGATERIAELKRRRSELEVKRDRPPGLASRYPGAGRGGRNMAAEAAYKQAVRHWMRTGDATYRGASLTDLQAAAYGRKSLHSELNPSGGYLVHPERVRGNPLEAELKELSRMRQRATIRQLTEGNELDIPINKKGTAAGWIGERQARPETDAPELGKVSVPLMELYAEPAISQRLLDSADTDPEAWLVDEVVEAFFLQETPAWFTGTGVLQPRGLLTYPFVTDHSTWAHGSFRLLETGVSGAFQPTAPTGSPPTMPDNILVDMVSSLKLAHRSEATWLLNRTTVGALRKLRDNFGRPLWQPSSQDGQPDKLLGIPIDEDEGMPDIGADTVSIGLGAWRKVYTIIERGGVRVIRDNLTQKPLVLFYTTKLVGGGVVNFDAAVFLRFST
jgi:HK97 family phage major capsid protein